MHFSPESFHLLAKQEGFIRELKTERQFQASFGVSPTVCSIAWELLKRPPKSQPKHILRTLNFQKVYASENVMAVTMAKTNKNTFRKWVWAIIAALAKLTDSLVSCCFPKKIMPAVLPRNERSSFLVYCIFFIFRLSSTV
jgi:hypothetical protein